jgi:hypothetical protein
LCYEDFGSDAALGKTLVDFLNRVAAPGSYGTTLEKVAKAILDVYNKKVSSGVVREQIF